MKQFIKIFFGSFFGAAFGVTAGFFILIGIVAAGISAISVEESNSKDAQFLQDGSVIVFDLAQPITEISNENLFGSYENYNLHDLRNAFEDASEDDKVKGLIIKMSYGTPIGWSTAKELRKILADFVESQKTVVSFGEYADEKSLYIASVAKKLYMHPTGEVSWNGFAAVPMFYKGLFEKLQMKPRIFKAGKFKSAVEPYTNEKMSPESRQQTEELLEDLWEETLEVVSASRNIDSNSLRSFAEGALVRTAKQAKRVDLIDGLVRYSDLLEMFLKDKSDDSEEEESEDADVPTYAKKDLKKFISLKGYVALKQENIFAAFEKNSLFSRTEDSKNKIAVLVLEGTIMPGKSEEGLIGSSSVVTELQKLRFDDKIKGVVLRVNSPGGSALASDVIWHEVEKLKKTKPVYVSMGDVAASGGYYISAGADKIFADVNTITGSIGVFSVLFGAEETFRSKAGLTFDRVVTNKFADLGSSVREMKDEERAIFNADVERIYGNFISVVSKGRGYTNTSEAEMVSQGRVWSGAQAKEVGLVDQIGGLEECILALSAELKLEDYETDYYPKKKMFESFFGGIFGTAAQIKSLNSALKSPAAHLQKVKESLSREQVLMLSPYSLQIN